MKEIAQYKEEVLARIANEQGRIREKRRSRLTLVYPFALAFAFLILLFPGIPGSPRTVSRPVDSDYTYHEAGTSVHEVAEDKSLDDPSLPAADEASFGGAGLTDSPEEMTGYRYYFFDVRILPVKDDPALSTSIFIDFSAHFSAIERTLPPFCDKNPDMLSRSVWQKLIFHWPPVWL